MRVLAALLLLPVTAIAGTKPAPVIIELAGDQPVAVRVYTGAMTPCNAEGNTKLFDGILQPKSPITIESDAICVCFQQTFAPFLTTGWSSPAIVCRPRRCPSKACPPALELPLRITARSKPY